MEVVPGVPPPLGLVSWWTGDGNANDIIGGHNGTLQPGVTFAAGQSGEAFSFNGSGAVEVPNTADLSLGPTTPFTIEFWENRSSSAEPLHLIGKREGCSPAGGVTINYQLACCMGFMGDTTGAGASFELPLDSWHHEIGRAHV